MKELWNHPSSCRFSSGPARAFLHSVCTSATWDSSVWPWIIIPRLTPAHRSSMSSVRITGPSWAPWDSAAWPPSLPPRPSSVRLCSLNMDVLAVLQLPAFYSCFGPLLFLIPLLGMSFSHLCPHLSKSCSFIQVLFMHLYPCCSHSWTPLSASVYLLAFLPWYLTAFASLC